MPRLTKLFTTVMSTTIPPSKSTVAPSTGQSLRNPADAAVILAPLTSSSPTAALFNPLISITTNAELQHISPRMVVDIIGTGNQSSLKMELAMSSHNCLQSSTMVTGARAVNWLSEATTRD